MKRFLDIFKGENKKDGSAKAAKDRLQILISNDISEKTLNSVMVRQMQSDILNVVRKYINITDDDIDIEVAIENGKEILGLNITFPEDKK